MYKILLVDDSKTTHAHLSNMLSETFIIHHLLDPRDCIEIIQRFEPDIVLLDLEMPHLDGFQLSKLIFDNNSIGAIPVLILTGSYSEKLIMAAINSNAMDIIPKNSKAEFLIQKINGTIRQKEMIECSTKEKQLMAINAMLATLNHEMNNSLQVLSFCLSRCHRDKNELNDELLLKMESSCERISSTIKKLNKLEAVQLENYTDKIPMLKI